MCSYTKMRFSFLIHLSSFCVKDYSKKVLVFFFSSHIHKTLHTRSLLLKDVMSHCLSGNFLKISYYSNIKDISGNIEISLISCLFLHSFIEFLLSTQHTSCLIPVARDLVQNLKAVSPALMDLMLQ